jgi:hypothetical protein
MAITTQNAPFYAKNGLSVGMTTSIDSFSNQSARNPILVIDSNTNITSYGNITVSGNINLEGTLVAASQSSMSSATIDRLTVNSPIVSTESIFPPFMVMSRTTVANLSANYLNGKTFESPAQIGSTTPNTGNFTTITAGNIEVANDLTVSGNLTVNGTSTTINSTILNVDDINITLGNVSTPSDITAIGGGITLLGTTNKTINWGSNTWTSSENFNLLTGKNYYINGASVLTNNTLGSGIVNSSLTSVGTLTSLTVGPVSVTGSITLTAGQYNGSGVGLTNIPNSALTNRTITVASGTGITVSGSPVALGGTVTINNSGVTGISGTTNQITADASTGNVILSLPTNINVTSVNSTSIPTSKTLLTTESGKAVDAALLNNKAESSLNVNYATYASTANAGFTVTGGSLTCTGDIIAFVSDKRLKDVTGNIENALDKVQTLTGVYYKHNRLAATYGMFDLNRLHVGLLAQDVQAVMPEIVKNAPFDIDRDGSSKSGQNFLTVQYEKLTPLLVEAIKELRAEVKELRSEVNELRAEIAVLKGK